MRYRLTYDGMWHLDIPKTRQYDHGKVEVVARNSSGETRVETVLTVKSRGDDYRGVLKNSPRRESLPILMTSLFYSCSFGWTTSLAWHLLVCSVIRPSWVWKEGFLKEEFLISSKNFKQNILIINRLCQTKSRQLFFSKQNL